MDKLKKYGRFLFSMKFALILLSLLLVICLFGSILPQGEADSYYTSVYPEKVGLLILLFGLDDTFRCPVFLIITGCLCLNLIGCNVIHFPALVRNWKHSFTPEGMLRYADATNQPVGETGSPESVITSAGFRRTERGNAPDGRSYLYSVRNKIGLAGAWLTHLGILIIILGFTLGQLFMQQYTVYGVPGQLKDIPGTSYALGIDSFEIGLREDETVEQYTSNVTMFDTVSGKSQKAEVTVNHPAKVFGMKLYQNSTGWACDMLVFQGEELIQAEVVCAGEALSVKDNEDLVIQFRAFYPDFVMSAAGKPATASSSLNNPGFLYAAYYQDRTIGMNVLTDGDYITIDDYTVAFENPRSYTLIQLKNDPFTWLALIGGIVIMIALIFAFYTNTEEILAVSTDARVWTLYVKSKKSELLLTERVLDQIAPNRN